MFSSTRVYLLSKNSQARSSITAPGGGSLASFSFPDRNAAGGAVSGAAAEDDEEEDLYS